MFTAALCLLYKTAVKSGFTAVALEGCEGMPGSAAKRLWDVTQTHSQIKREHSVWQGSRSV